MESKESISSMCLEKTLDFSKILFDNLGKAGISNQDQMWWMLSCARDMVIRATTTLSCYYENPENFSQDALKKFNHNLQIEINERLEQWRQDCNKLELGF